jgi:hypothetical protein
LFTDRYGDPVPYGFNTISELVEYREGIREITYLIEHEEESSRIKDFYN